MTKGMSSEWRHAGVQQAGGNRGAATVASVAFTKGNSGTLVAPSGNAKTATTGHMSLVVESRHV